MTRWNDIATVTNPTTNHEITYATDALGNRVAEQDGVGATSAPVLVVNNGSVQRSMVDSLTVVFPQRRDPLFGRFEPLQHHGQRLRAAHLVQPERRRQDLAGHLHRLRHRRQLPAQRRLRLTLTAADVSGITLSSNVTWAFHRLFGDADGNGTVNGADQAAFQAAYGASSGNPLYDPAFDYSAVGRVNNTAVRQFSWTTAPPTPTRRPARSSPAPPRPRRSARPTSAVGRLAPTTCTTAAPTSSKSARPAQRRLAAGSLGTRLRQQPHRAGHGNRCRFRRRASPPATSCNTRWTPASTPPAHS